MKNTSDYWKGWFDDRAKNATSDYVLNRGTTIRLTELERRAEQQFLGAVDPQAADVVLDAGCGSGRNISLLSARVKEIVGLDFSSEMLQRAGGRVSEEKLPNVKLVLGSVTQIPFPDAAFDKVICTSVLQYLEDGDCADAFREMFRVCRDGGVVVVHIKNGTSLYGLSKAAANAVSRLLRRRVVPEYYRSRAWHESVIRKLGGSITGFDSFGIFTCVRMPRALVQRILQAETRLIRARWLRKFGVNFKLTIRVAKGGA